MTESYVVLDTNAWTHATRLLRSPLGVALLHAVGQSNSKIVLPEVVEVEIEEVTRRTCAKHSAAAQQSLRDLESLLGREIPPVPLPSENDVIDSVSDRLAQLKSLLQRAPLSLKHTRSALHRVAKGHPPAHRSEQFRDSLIWEVVNEFGQRAPTYFVTSDKAFYEASSYEKGLAKALRHPASDVTISSEVNTFLESVGAQAPEPTEHVQELIHVGVSDLLDRYLDPQVLFIGSLESCDLQAFLTDIPGVHAYDFSARYRVVYHDVDYSDEDPVAQGLTVTGEALVSAQPKRLLDIRIHSGKLDDGVLVTWPDESLQSFEFKDLKMKRSRVPATR